MRNDTKLLILNNVPGSYEAVQNTLATVIHHESNKCVLAKDIIECLIRNDIHVFFIGGTTRDALLGMVPKDIDIAINADIQKAHEILNKHFPFTNALQGYWEDFGLLKWGNTSAMDVVILRDHKNISDEYYYEQKFNASTSILHDAECRDFSINSIYFDFNTNNFIDPFGVGYDDLKSKTLRLITHENVLKSDHRIFLRMLKFILRGYQPDPNCRKLLQEQLPSRIVSMGIEEASDFILAQYLLKKEDPSIFWDLLK